MATDPELPRTRDHWRATGLSDRQIDRRLRSGDLGAARRGQLTTGVPNGTAHIHAAFAAQAARRLVVSHLSAARLMGLPEPLTGWPEPEFTASTGPTRQRDGLRVAVAPLDGQIGMLGDLPVTLPARTVTDVLRTAEPRDALAIADAALHRRLTTLTAVGRALAQQRGWPGVVRARQLALLADGRRESPLESWSAWGFHRAGVPRPRWQVVVRTRDGRFVARGDTWWPGVVGEADGRSKYRTAAAQRGREDATTLYDVLEEERRRERNLRDFRSEVVRWSPRDVLDDDRLRRLAARIHATIALAQETGPFLGLVSVE